MASIRKKENSPFWFACFALPDGKRTQRSTGIPHGGVKKADLGQLQATLAELLGADVKITEAADAGAGGLSVKEARRLAERVATQFDDAARAGADGKFTDVRARKTIADIYALSNSETLSNSSAGDFLDAWLKRKELETVGHTHERYTGVISDFKKYLGSKVKRDIATISAADISGFRDTVAKRLATGTVNITMKIVRSAFAQARRDGLVDVNEAERVSLLKRQDRFERRPFTLGELKRILESADEEWKGMILVGLYTGQRLGDIAGLTWQNIDLQRAELRLVTGKTGRRQILPMAAPLLRHVEKLASSDDPAAPLFPRAFAVLEGQGRAGNISNAFHKILVSAGLAEKQSHHKAENGKGREGKRQQHEVSFHSLRHTATSLLKSAGVSESVAMEFIGHDSRSVSAQYTHIDTATLKLAAEKMPDVTK